MYTEEFKAIVKELYPESTFIHTLVNEGSWKLGAQLKKKCEFDIEHRDIMAATSLEELQEASVLLEARKALYERWLDGRPGVTVDCTEQMEGLH